MNQIKIRMLRVLRIAIVMFIWYGIAVTAFSFSLGETLAGIIELAIVGIAIYILIDGRLLLKLKEKDREMRGFFLVPMYLLIASMIYDIIVSFELNDLYILDQLHYPGLIVYIRSGGLIILVAILLWETIALARDYFASKK
jgi:hypothetical protein